MHCRLSARILAVSLSALLVACGSTPDAPTTAGGKAARQAVRKASSSAAAAVVAKTLPAAYAIPDAQLMLQRLIPARVQDSGGWANDITTAMGALRVPMSPENLCSVLAIIEQESSFQADPEVPNLPAIVRKEIEARRARYSIPEFVVEKGLQRKSSDGRTYAARIDALRTESDVSRLYEDVNDELPDIARKYQPSNPVHTAGAMQVNVAFAEDFARGKSYPYGRAASVRRETFTRRGGIYYGIALLLDYAAPYPAPMYRFADYNAGRFSSRNAAFQLALSRLSTMQLAPDGDLLIYVDGKPSETPSNTQRALESLAVTLGIGRADIRRELLLEKSEAFISSRLWQRVFLMADAAAGQPVPRHAMPQISVQSPKFKRTLTTNAYASQVDGRWSSCMSRQKGLFAG